MTNRRGFLYSVFASALGGAMSTRAAPAPTPRGLPPFPDDNDPEFWDRIRDQFYIPRGEAFFNTGTIGSVPRPVLERVIEDMRTLEATVTRWDYSENTPNWISGYSPELPLRDKLGKLVNVEGKRSEEHTSELQSHSDLVCRLLLEKKKPEYERMYPYGTTP